MAAKHRRNYVKNLVRGIYFKDQHVRITWKDWKGSKEGVITNTTSIRTTNDLVTVTLPEGNVDFAARNIQVL
jgi:hypothetical protein